ncbi:hypothetical protein [Picrophilus oshimae]|uniref:Uncharacterized protein n=1 Tax=Picrophilus torridus (strain ATCC 700027 / DSM 9790 / JCM 10055 / NBRC 100828 / KAW 2/3) TaxID=1122961 RepID=A0A8G2FXU7_PICTO|nr:hypothetical protein [Picrophilus oshimae]SMD31517.1 hypothetical protein SAMN02745355_1464 [Picrophilus oshimae DSM 9789]
MTVISKNDYTKFFWVHRKTLLIISITILILRFVLSFLNNIITNILNFLSLPAAFIIIEILFMYSFKKDLNRIKI